MSNAKCQKPKATKYTKCCCPNNKPPKTKRNAKPNKPCTTCTKYTKCCCSLNNKPPKHKTQNAEPNKPCLLRLHQPFPWAFASQRRQIHTVPFRIWVGVSGYSIGIVVVIVIWIGVRVTRKKFDWKSGWQSVLELGFLLCMCEICDVIECRDTAFATVWAFAKVWAFAVWAFATVWAFAVWAFATVWAFGIRAFEHSSIWHSSVWHSSIWHLPLQHLPVTWAFLDLDLTIWPFAFDQLDLTRQPHWHWHWHWHWHFVRWNALALAFAFAFALVSA